MIQSKVREEPMVPKIELGEYIVANPKICHGRLTFKGTRVFVSDVLEQVAEGMDWDTIVKEWRGSITKEAIAEAVQLASQTFLKQVERSYGTEAAS